MPCVVASISHLKTFGKTADSEIAFGGLGDMLKAGKDFPMAMRDLTEDLIGIAGGPSGKVENQAVLEAIESKFGGNLPDPLLKGLKQILFNPQGRQDTGAFAIDTLVAELTEGGNISEFLTKGFQQLQKRLGDSDDALRNFRNSFLFKTTWSLN